MDKMTLTNNLNLPGDIVQIILDELILNELKKEKINILSEETGEVNFNESNLRFIVDPLDGTVNFIRDISQCSVSIALYDGLIPIFGVLGIFPSFDIVWGMSKKYSYLNETKINVSSIKELSKSIICSGFPSRFDYDDKIKLEEFFKLLKKFSKTRMLGSAAVSLFNVAKGSADYYFEKNIMIWDVAAGLSILSGAGGCFEISETKTKNMLEVKASNGLLKV